MIGRCVHLTARERGEEASLTGHPANPAAPKAYDCQGKRCGQTKSGTRMQLEAAPKLGRAWRKQSSSTQSVAHKEVAMGSSEAPLGNRTLASWPLDT